MSSTSTNHSLFREVIVMLSPFKGLMILATILGVVSGLSTTALLATINDAVNSTHNSYTEIITMFAGLCVLVLACTTASNLIINYVGQKVLLQLRQRLAKQVLLAPISQLEQYRSNRLIPVLVHDIDAISNFSLSVAPLVISFAVTMGCMAYLTYLSWELLLLTAMTVLIGSSVQYIAFKFGRKHLDIARDSENDLQKHYQGLSDGAKELRIQRPRRSDMFSSKIQGTTAKICQANIRAANIFISAETLGSLFFFIVIGVAIGYSVFVPSANISILSGFVLVMLYMRGPLQMLIGAVPNIAHTQVAFNRVAELSEQFASSEPQLNVGDNKTNYSFQDFNNLTLKNACYQFPAVEDKAPFVLGPINVDIQQGDIVFIVGDNGSGKTTLIKLLLGLYQPTQGHIKLNDQEVTDDTLDDYRQLFTTIFSDYYLFDEVSNHQQSLPEEASKYLALMKLEHKVSIKDGAFTSTDLSTGQRKRLALINAWLESRPVLVFDEWAADQDPVFRKIFYTELLPELRALGKTIIVISHDDRYFYIADRLLKMNAGEIITEELEQA